VIARFSTSAVTEYQKGNVIFKPPKCTTCIDEQQNFYSNHRALNWYSLNLSARHHMMPCNSSRSVISEFNCESDFFILPGEVPCVRDFASMHAECMRVSWELCNYLIKVHTTHLFVCTNLYPHCAVLIVTSTASTLLLTLKRWNHHRQFNYVPLVCLWFTKLSCLWIFIWTLNSFLQFIIFFENPGGPLSIQACSRSNNILSCIRAFVVFLIQGQDEVKIHSLISTPYTVSWSDLQTNLITRETLSSEYYTVLRYF